MTELQTLREKEENGTISHGEVFRLRLLEKQEEERRNKENAEYRSKYFELSRKYDYQKKEIAELEERNKMHESTIQTLLAALQGKIRD